MFTSVLWVYSCLFGGNRWIFHNHQQNVKHMGISWDLPLKTTHLGGFHWGFYEYSILLRALAVSWGKQRKDPKHLGMATAHLCLPQKYINPCMAVFVGKMMIL
jgi:hypothetical protein